MTPRKPKPRKPAPHKAAKPTMEQRISVMEAAREFDGEWLEEINKRLDALETRSRYRDASHDEPVSNASEAIGQHFRIVGELPSASWWRRFVRFMEAP